MAIGVRVLAMVVAAMLLSALPLGVLAESGVYEDAVGLIEQGRFQAAADAFSTLGEYWESKNYRLYATAREYERTGYFEQAGMIYGQLADFLDSEQRGAALLPDERMYDYRDAVKRLDEGDLEGARALLEALGDYMDAAALLESLSGSGDPEAAYREALEQMEAGRYEEAMRGFEALGDYEDSLLKMLACQVIWQEATYGEALALEERGEAEAAIEKYRALGQYRDSEQRAEQLAADQKPPEQGQYPSEHWLPFYDEAAMAFGYMEASGRVALLPAWDEVKDFTDGVAMARSGAKWGLIGEAGEWIAPATCDELYLQQEGYWLGKQNGLYAVLDAQGLLVSGLSYRPVASKDGMLLVHQNELYGYVDLKNRGLIAQIYSDAEPFSEGLAVVKEKDAEYYGYIDRTGAYVLSPSYVTAEPFEGGLAYVYIGGRAPEGKKEGYINAQGELVFPLSATGIGVGGFSDGFALWYDDGYRFLNEQLEPAFGTMKFEYAQRFVEGYAEVTTDEGKGILRTDGKYAVEPAYDIINRWNDDMFLVHMQGVYGLYDGDGNVVLPMDYEWIGALAEGRAVVKRKGLYGFIDEKGAVVVEPRYDEANEYSEGLAAVRRGAVWGYIDGDGEVALPFAFDAAVRGFKDGVAGHFDSATGKYTYIDRDGARSAGWIQYNEKSLHAYFDEKERRYGYIYPDGTVAIEPRFLYADRFSGGYALVVELDAFAVINTNGDVCFYPEVEDIATPSGGRIAFIAPGGKGGYMDTAGRVVIEPQWEYVGMFYSGRALVRDENNRVGYIDTKGEVIVPCQYEDGFDYSEGKAVVYDGAYHVLDIDGNVIYSLEAEALYSYSDGLAAVNRGDLIGFLDSDGEFALPERYFNSSSFSSGYTAARLEEGGQYGFIDTSGAWIIEPKFEEAYLFSGGLGLVAEGGKYGFTDLEGELVIPYRYDSVLDIFGVGLAHGVVDGRHELINRRGEVVKSWMEPEFTDEELKEIQEQAEAERRVEVDDNFYPDQEADGFYEEFMGDFTPLERGDTGDEVELIQQCLIDMGYLYDEADGNFGVKTEAAVKRFQGHNVLQETGQVDWSTYYYLVMGLGEAYAEEDVMIGFGNRGEWEKNGSKMNFRVQIENQSLYRTVKSVTIALYWEDKDGNRLEGDHDYYTFESETKIKPGETKYTGYVALPDRKKIGRVHCAIYEVEYTDGTYGVRLPEDFHYYYWNIQW